MNSNSRRLIGWHRVDTERVIGLTLSEKNIPSFIQMSI
jgi:hypothetical protein